MKEPSKLQQYVLLDGAKIGSVYRYLYTKEPQPEWVALYRQTDLEALDDISPILVSTQANSLLLQDVEQVLGPEGKAIRLTSADNLGVVSEHLRSMLYASGNAGERILFRFYEVRALDVLQKLPTTSQTLKFFGPVRSFSWVSPQYLFWQEWQRPDSAEHQVDTCSSLSSRIFPLPEEWEKALKKAQRVPTAAQIMRFLTDHSGYSGKRDTQSVLTYARTALEHSRPLKPRYWEEVQEYFDLCLLHGPDFLTREVIPGTAGILSDPTLTCSEKLQRLNDRSLFM